MPFLCFAVPLRCMQHKSCATQRVPMLMWGHTNLGVMNLDTKDYRVFPVEFVHDWPNRATTDPPDHWALDDLRVETSGLLVIDLDNHGGADGLAAWEALGFVSSPIATTSASGTGRHLYWRLPDDVDPQAVRCSAGFLAPGVDVRSWHGNAKETAAAFASLPPRLDLPVAPRGLLTVVQRVDVAQTTEGRTDGPTAAALHPWVASAVRARCEEVAAASVGNNANDVQTSAARRLVLLANNPASGLATTAAYSAYREACTAAGAWDDKAEYRWTSAAVKYAHEMAHVPTQADEPNTLDEAEIEAAERVIRIKQEAERRVAASNHRGTQVLTWDEMTASAGEWLVDGWLLSASTTFLVGAPNIGKTFTFIDLAARCALGLPWFGQQTKPGTRTMFVLAEGHARFIARLQAWARAYDLPPDVLKPYVSFVVGGNLNNDSSLAILRDEAARHNPDLIIIDTYSGASGVGDEDKAALNAETINRAKSIKAGAAVLFTHHPTKSTEETDCPTARGSGTLKDNADAMLTMYWDHAYRARDGAEREYVAVSTETAHGGKIRDAGKATIRGLYLEAVDGAESLVLVQDTTGVGSKGDAAVVSHLGQDMTVTGFVEAVNKDTGAYQQISVDTARRWLNAAVKSGLAIKNHGKGRTADTWSLAA